MYRYRALLAGVLAFVFSAGCVLGSAVSLVGSGDVIAREISLSGFERVEISHGFRVQIRQGESYRVVVRIDDNLEEYLKVSKEGGTLKIGLKPGRTYSVRRATMEAEVTMPELAGLGLSGASHAAISGFESSQDLEIGLSGASSLKGDVGTGKARFSLSGSSEMELTGSAGDLVIHASGSSEADLSTFAVADAEVTVSGSSTVTVNPAGRLDVSASGSSDVYYRGEPTLGRLNTSGNSSVERR